jgi:hypothetical protein
MEPALNAHFSTGSSQVAFIGSHCGGECIWFVNHFPNANVSAYEEGPYSVAWSDGLTAAYGYKNLSFYERSIKTTRLKPSNYDYVVAQPIVLKLEVICYKGSICQLAN